MANQAFVPNFRNPMNNDVPFPQLLRPKEPSLFESLAQNLKDALFPEKLPPLKLTSRPVAVRDIWERKDRKRSAGTSLAIHSAVIAALIVGSIWGGRAVKQIQKDKVIDLVAPDISEYIPMTKPGPTMGGGGGGGDLSKIEAPKGHLPKVNMQQITPPAIVIKNENPKLAVDPSIMAPPTMKLPDNNMPVVGNPMTKVVGPASNGSGMGGGIGEGSGGGLGVGTGRGLGPGSGMGFGGGVYKVGGGIGAPRPVSTPDPEYSEEARKAKYQGVVVLWLIVDQNGNPKQIKVERPLGMGLDQKAIEAVRKWKFEPATKDGQPVAVQINVEVNFRLY
jgi:periplasmic protein TonB